MERDISIVIFDERCYSNYKLNKKIMGADISQLKGKQVKILYDLVTVISEHKVRCLSQPLGNLGRRP